MSFAKNTYDMWSPGSVYGAYVSHEQEKEDVINMIVAAANTGKSDISISLNDYFSANDIEYIKTEVSRRLN